MTKEELEKYKIIKEIHETSEGGSHHSYYILKNKRRWIIIYFIFGILILASLFYWYSYRPAQIKKECASWAVENSKYGYGGQINYELVDVNYKQCTREKGL
jgi:hypothetical protein